MNKYSETTANHTPTKMAGEKNNKYRRKMRKKVFT